MHHGKNYKKGSDENIKRWINEQLKGASVTVVLIGYKTSESKWVQYEIMESISDRKGLLVFKYTINQTSTKKPTTREKIL